MSEHLMVLPAHVMANVTKAAKYKSGLYAAPPGTGPKGETCGSCKHLYRKHMGKTYLKCELVVKLWTGGGGTDVKARAEACSKWESAVEADEAQRARPSGARE